MVAELSMVKFLFFAQLAELAERDALELEYQVDWSMDDYLAELSEKLPKPAIDLLTDGATMVSINQTLASWSDTLSDDDEVGLLPPFSGG